MALYVLLFGMKYLALIAAVICLSSTYLAAELKLDEARLSRIDPLMEAWIEEGLFPGGAVLVSQGNDILMHATYGTTDGIVAPVSEETLYRMFSMTKPITVAAALVLYERGDFLLDDEIHTLWPEMKKLRVYVSGDGDSMVTKVPNHYPTVQDLMMHTAGFYYAYSDHPAHKALKTLDIPKTGASISDVALQIAEAPLLFEPSSQWNYGYSQDILAGLVEHLAGEPYEEFLAREILEPLGIEDIGYTVPEAKQHHVMDLFKLGEDGSYMQIPEDTPFADADPVAWGGTGLVASAEAYWTFTRMLMQGGTWEGKRILSPTTVDYMLSNHLAEALLPFEQPGSPYGRFAKGNGFGLGVEVRMQPELSENISSIGEASWSGAASTHFWMIPEHDIVVIFLTQNRSFLDLLPIAERVRVSVYQSLVSD